VKTEEDDTNMQIRKAVIPAAGLGTRFLPATKSQPKEMLPIVDKPCIQYVIEEAINAGITDILIITGRGKRAIEDHFDISFELEYYLKERGKTDLLTQVRNISCMANIHYVRQKEPKGLGHAILAAKSYVGNEPFAVFLGDDIVDSDVPCIKQLMEAFEKFNCSVLAVEEVKMEDVKNYGVISGKKVEEDCYMVDTLVEKPDVASAPSNLAIIGRYILTPEIFSMLENTEPDKKGEIQLTNGLIKLRESQVIYAKKFRGKRYDIGTKVGYLMATVKYALKDKNFSEDFKTFLKDIVSELN